MPSYFCPFIYSSLVSFSHDTHFNRYQWPRDLRRGSASSGLLGLRAQILSPGAWMSVSSECWVFSCRVLCDWPINPPEDSYRMCWVSECHSEALIMRRLLPTRGSCTMKKIILSIENLLKYRSRSANVLVNYPNIIILISVPCIFYYVYIFNIIVGRSPVTGPVWPRGFQEV
jgi:hypothetical protein